MVFYINFGPFLHLQYRKIYIEAFLQSVRYSKYLSFATLVNPVTVVGGWALCISLISFFCRTSAEELLSMSRNQNCFLGRIKQQVSDEFQTCIQALNMNMRTCWRSKMFETRQMGKLVQHHQRFSNTLRDQLKVCAFFKFLVKSQSLKVFVWTTA